MATLATRTSPNAPQHMLNVSVTAYLLLILRRKPKKPAAICHHTCSTSASPHLLTVTFTNTNLQCRLQHKLPSHCLSLTLYLPTLHRTSQLQNLKIVHLLKGLQVNVSFLCRVHFTEPLWKEILKILSLPLRSTFLPGWPSHLYSIGEVV